jgi:hypothetical protein
MRLRFDTELNVRRLDMEEVPDGSAAIVRGVASTMRSRLCVRFMGGTDVHTWRPSLETVPGERKDSEELRRDSPFWIFVGPRVGGFDGWLCRARTNGGG